MTGQTLEERVARLETHVGELSEVPAKLVELRSEMRSEFVALRTEMSNEFEAVRSEMRSEFVAVRSEMRSELVAVRSEMRNELVAVRSEMRNEFVDVRSEMSVQGERLENIIKQGDEDTRTYMRVLFEKHVADLRIVDEGRVKTRKKR